MKRTDKTPTSTDRDLAIDELLENVTGGSAITCFLPIIPGEFPNIKGIRHDGGLDVR